VRHRKPTLGTPTPRPGPHKTTGDAHAAAPRRLWGAFSGFRDFDGFVNGITNRGVGGLEMLAMEMKATGTYVSRGLSYEQAEFELVQAPLTEAQKGGFDAAARFWGERLRPALERAAELTKVEKRIMTAFWGSHQRFFKQADATPFPLHTHPRREVPRPPRR
jgi:hypothetical protein